MVVAKDDFLAIFGYGHPQYFRGFYDVPVTGTNSDQLNIFNIVTGVQTYGPEIFFFSMKPVLSPQYLLHDSGNISCVRNMCFPVFGYI
jgi:hypothetical protein